MNQSPKKGRVTREAGDKSYEDASGTKVVPTTQRLCRSNNSTAFAVKEWTDWTGTRRMHPEMYKVDTCTGNTQDMISQPLAKKEECLTLPVIRKGVAQGAAAKNRTINKTTEVSHLLKTSKKKGKVKPNPTVPNDMTPWVKASPSESSLTALLQTVPSPQLYFEETQKNALNKVSWSLQASEQPTLKDKTHSRQKQKARTGVTKRRTMNKLQNIKLPPVPAVTELSFSRNFSFSFFELPKHQSPQHWLQRQKSVYVLMRQLH